MDSLLCELELSHVGCYMGGVFVGAFMYADDIKLLAPTIYALNKMVEICVNFAKKYDVLFNDKSQLLVYKSMDNVVAIPDVELNGSKINVVNDNRLFFEQN